MSLTSHDDIPTTVLDGAVRDYSRDKVYVLTAIFLAVVTVLEIFTYTFPDFPVWADELLVPVLLLMLAVKFFTVAYIFMHLRFDKPLLTWVFYAGVGLAVAVYVAMLAAFRFF